MSGAFAVGRTWFNQLFRYAMVEVNLGTNPAADLDIVATPTTRHAQSPPSHERIAGILAEASELPRPR
jgi:hypothetical protein